MMGKWNMEVTEKEDVTYHQLGVTGEEPQETYKNARYLGHNSNLVPTE
jgi:hypothetical protein